MLKRILSISLLLCWLCASVAGAVKSGTYQGRTATMEGLYGEICIASLEGQLATGEVRTVELFSITRFDGVEPIDYYAGVLTKNTDKEARGVVLYRMTRQDYFDACYNNSFAGGAWLEKLGQAEDNIIFKQKGNRLSYEAPAGKNCYANSLMMNNYRYLGPRIHGRQEAALKVVELAVVRRLCGAEPLLEEESYLVRHDDMRFAHFLTTKYRNASIDYLIEDDLKYVGRVQDDPNLQPHDLLVVPHAYPPFGNAVVVPQSAYVYADCDTGSRKISQRDQGERLSVVFYTEHTAAGGKTERWAYVEQPSGEYGYIPASQVKED